MTTETIRAEFERFMSDDGKWPKAIERCGAGNYILSQSASSWRVWRSAYHQCLQSPEVQALRDLLKEARQQLPLAAQFWNEDEEPERRSRNVKRVMELIARIDAAMEKQHEP